MNRVLANVGPDDQMVLVLATVGLKSSSVKVIGMWG